MPKGASLSKTRDGITVLMECHCTDVSEPKAGLCKTEFWLALANTEYSLVNG